MPFYKRITANGKEALKYTNDIVITKIVFSEQSEVWVYF